MTFTGPAAQFIPLQLALKKGILKDAGSEAEMVQMRGVVAYDGSKAFSEDGSVPEKGLRLVIDETRKAVKVNCDVALSEIADLAILRDAQRELGIKIR